MKSLCSIFLLYAIMHISYPCIFQERTPKFVGTHITNSWNEGIFGKGRHKTDSNCMNLRLKPQNRKPQESRIHPTCEEIVPGLNYLENGCIENFFYATVDELKQQLFEKLLDFTCNTNDDNENSKFEFNDVPSEVSWIRPTNHKHVDKKILSLESIKKVLMNNTRLTKPENEFFLKLPLLHFEKTPKKFVKYLAISLHVYNVKLRNDITPNKKVLLEYEKLPPHWSSDVDAYSEFIMRFGTHYRNSSILGGTLILLISPAITNNDKENTEDSETIDDLVNKVTSIKEGKHSMAVLRSFGGSSSIQNFSMWKISVPEDPVPLVSTFIPINQLLDPTMSNKSLSLFEFIQFEMDHQNYKRYYYMLKLLNDKNELAQFVFNLIEKQLKYTCSSKYLNLIIHGIEDGNNPYLDKFYFSCSIITTKTHVQYNIWEHKSRRRVHITPHICFTFKKHLVECKDAKILLPTNVKCLQLFETENCTGTAFNVFNESQMDKLFINNTIMSVLLCNNS